MRQGRSELNESPTLRETQIQPPGSAEERPPIIRRADVVAFALVALLTIVIVAALYVTRTLLMPIITAFVVGTMLSAGARLLEQYRIPRIASILLMLTATCGIFALIIALISAPLLEWTSRLPELSVQFKEKLQVFDRPLAIWHQVQLMFGANPSEMRLPLPKIEWVQPTLEFLSPTLAEFLLFFVTLILFVASWPDLRRSLILTFGERECRLRTVRILNEIEEHLGGYLLTVTMINLGVGITTGVICSITGMPNPAALGALAATLNYIPIIGPVVMFAVLLVVGLVTSSTLGTGLIAPLLFACATFLEGHFITPTIIGRHLELNALAVFIAFAFWAWLWGPIGAFLASPMLIVALILKEHLIPTPSPQLPTE